MATYLHGNSDQFQSADGGLQTLLLMNPSYVQFSDSPPPPSHPNLVYFNSLTAANTFSTQNLSHAPQQFVGIPLPTTAGSPSSHDNNSYSLNTHHDVSAIHGFVPRGPHDIWKAIDPTTAARENARARAQQGLSLSLSSQHPLGFGSRDVQSQTQQAVSGDENVRISGGSSSSASGITNGIQGVLIGSKYLKAAQEILDEVVNVTQNVIKKESSPKKVVGDQNNIIGNTSAEGSIGGAATEGKPAAERQEIEMKKGKLISMLDEVEQRYRKYEQEMEAVKSRFEEAAGAGSGRTYTALAVETISKQFRCIKEAIGGEIKAAKKSLGEEERTEGSGYNHLRQHRAFQHNAWRPQRGLPERSVSILRAWLFQHFLHPYPKDSDKHMLAKQTGLTRSQVSNWFINARVRLWKPMVEEMYMEEIKEQEQNNGGSAPAPATATAEEKTNEDSFSKSITTETKSPNSKQELSPIQNPSGFTLIGASSELEGITHRSPKKQRGPQILHSEEEEQQNRDGYSFLGQTHFNIAGFGQYPIGEIGRFDADQFPQRFSGNNGVSLTLGLPHCENHLSVNHQNYIPNQSIHLGRRTEIGKPTDYSAINIQNGKSFAAQLLPDFVA